MKLRLFLQSKPIAGFWILDFGLWIGLEAKLELFSFESIL